MANETLKIDANNKPVIGMVTDDVNQYIKMGRIDDTTKGLKVILVGGTGAGTVTSITASTGLTASPNPIIGAGTISLDSKLSPLDSLAGNALKVPRVNAGETALEYATVGSGTVTSVSVVTSQGVSGSVATATTTPAITLTLGTLTGVTSFNGLVITANTGTITTGTWNATTISVPYGGTGATTLTGVLIGNGTSAISAIANPSSDTLFGWDNTDTLQKYITIGTGLTYTHATHTLSATGSGGTVTSVSGTTNRITSTGGATPIIDISASYVGQSSITTLGTISTGVWNGTIVTSAYGGTGNGFTKFSGATTSEKTYTLPDTSTSILTTANTITVGQGGTGATTLTVHGVLIGNTTSPINVTSAGTTGQVLTSNGASADPTFQTLTGTVTYKNGVASRADNAASGNQTIAHGLGIVPKKVNINCTYGHSGAGSVPAISTGNYNGTTTATTYTAFNGKSAGNDTTSIIIMFQNSSGTGGSQQAVISVDATNITLAWTLTGGFGSSDGTLMYFNWEAEA